MKTFAFSCSILLLLILCCPSSTVTSPPSGGTVAAPTPTKAPPTEAPPTVTLIPIATSTPPSPPTETPMAEVPTDTPILPEPIATPPPAEAQVIIITVNKREEYVDIQNVGGAPQDLTGWRLLSEKGSQSCLLRGIIQPDEILRIWAMAQDADQDGYNCGYDTPIWNNQERDPAVLYNAANQEIDRK